MRCFEGLAGLVAGTGLIAIGAIVAVGCGADFSGCEASRTCPTGGTAGNAGGGTSARAGADDGGSGTQGGGTGGSSSGKGGSSPSHGGASGSKGGHGGTGGSSGTSIGAGEGGVSSTNGTSGETSGAGATLGQSGASQDAAGGEAGTDSMPPVGDAPTVVSTTPGYEEKGVRDDVEISITFSAPMNTASVEQAFMSEQLPVSEKVKLMWTDNDTRLVITHTEPLEYASVTSLDEPSTEYAVTIGSTATDTAGNALGENFTLPFYTLRDVTQDFVHSSGRELTHPNDGTQDSWTQPCTLLGNAAPLSAGDDDADVTLAFGINFRVSDLAAGIVRWKSATVQGAFTTSSLNPFPRLGELWGYGALVALNDLVWSSPTAYIGSAAQFASQGQFKLDVLDYLADFYVAPPTSQLVLVFKFQHDTNADGQEQSLSADCDGMTLHVEYLAP